jgi:hypothetical protein
VTVVLAIVVPVFVGYSVMRPFRAAVDVRSELEERFGAQDAYVPGPDGAIPAERIEAFLHVRAAVEQACAGLNETSERFLAMERFDGQEQVSSSEVMRAAWRATRSAMGMAPLMGQLFEARNEALLEAEMGLGEYTYIYVLAYLSELQSPSPEQQVFEEDAANSRVRRALVRMLSRQHEAALAAGSPEQDLAALAAEIAAMEQDPERLPWQDGLPAAVAASLDPFRQRLDDSFCAGTAPFDLLRNTDRGIAIESE